MVVIGTRERRATAPILAQADPHQHHHHEHGTLAEHSHEVGPAGATFDLRWLDAMVQHHTGALRMSEFVFNIGSPGVGALASGIWREQAREIKAMGQWRRATGDPDTMAGLLRMSAAQIEAMRMMGDPPSRGNRVTWSLEGMLAHHGGALEMAHDALAKSTNPTVRRLARQIIVSQRQEILERRRMLRHDGLDKPGY